MYIDGSKVSAIVIYVAIATAPFIVWLALYTASCWWSVGLRPVLSWIRALRWIGWISGMAVAFIQIGLGHFPVYGLAIGAFSEGLSFPESWVKRRFAPDTNEPKQSPRPSTV